MTRPHKRHPNSTKPMFGGDWYLTPSRTCLVRYCAPWLIGVVSTTTYIWIVNNKLTKETFTGTGRTRHAAEERANECMREQFRLHGYRDSG